ncbi:MULTISPECIES: hypothetical protein [Halorussus]|uniref:hypothetical protein n=1 Tax=Halorussus TaxID=1070314 RepID=UPI000E2164D8|nr:MULTISPECIES: hypothetical protein [Halorussus]NHN58616.1 hypothetical protein [Halorussus sp. JP-T4]
MVPGTRDALLTALTAAALLAGTVLVVLPDSTATVVGILLSVVGSLVFTVDAKDLVVKTVESVRE